MAQSSGRDAHDPGDEDDLGGSIGREMHRDVAAAIQPALVPAAMLFHHTSQRTHDVYGDHRRERDKFHLTIDVDGRTTTVEDLSE